MKQKIKELLRGRPVLVTGADGFVGSHLTETLVGYGALVYAFVRATSSGSLTNIDHLQKFVTVLRGDIGDKSSVLGALKILKNSGGPDKRPIIFHLGAQAHVGESWQRPYETVVSNVIGTMNILQSIVDLNLDIYKLDTAGSSEEYGNIDRQMRNFYNFDQNGGLILSERSPLNPQSVYATSKIASDFLTRNYAAAYGVPAVVSRMFNNYGPRQNPRFITGTIITQAILRDTIELGEISTKRDFCYVDDGVRGHIDVALFGKPGNVYVFGSGKTISIKDWYEKIIELGRKEGFWKRKRLVSHIGVRTRLGKSEVEELRVDFTKLNDLTGWKPRYTWDEGLIETIAWYASSIDRWRSKVDWTS
ncbi:GDP-mannose 4,6-dehydratase [Candidatus Gottesmanbacteria bacterium RIFCSPLOWO2_01_FULL_46_21]|uniref:GDP-mannose 4,6-dehydratase n=1 Tax=Candidatus Gottesmanbacteria bacterium RIFCSPLOWO2_01_FULL_46_21 TaxID=1798393 RepID=A0A1F6AYU7_9BACT|nr:MAG: GDP-mannose 4,6-dehydratase [Candidatus Gottesmanbacteria bacterium RIFCSPLOWO2_01_FULL_46_21]